jgi:tetratricopeptide (TPR) repeat protein
MALLYGSKYKYNRSLGGGSTGDVERAEYYLALASDYLGETYYLLNEIGLLYLEFYDPRDPETQKAYYCEAERLFRKSVLNKNDQQRAHYNLGVLAAKRNEWGKAAGHYADALQFPNWEEGRRPEMECNVVYNAACVWARLCQVDKVLHYLNKTAELGYVRVRTVNRDYTEREGDFVGLLSGSDEQTKSALLALQSKLSRRAGEEPTAPSSGPGFWRRLDNAFKALTADP